MIIGEIYWSSFIYIRKYSNNIKHNVVIRLSKGLIRIKCEYELN